MLFDNLALSLFDGKCGVAAAARKPIVGNLNLYRPLWLYSWVGVYHREKQMNDRLYGNGPIKTVECIWGLRETGQAPIPRQAFTSRNKKGRSALGYDENI